MNEAEYLSRLRSSLKGMAPDEQAGILEEIAAHLSESESDPALGQDPTGGAQRLTREMGDPADLGRRMNRVHHPGRWIDYLLLVMPQILLSPLLTLAAYLLFPASQEPGMPIRPEGFAWMYTTGLLFNAAWIVLGAWRYRRYGLPEALVFWLSAGWLAVFSNLFRNRLALSEPAALTPGKILGIAALLIALVGLTVWLVRLLRHLRDPLLLVLALIPFTVASANLITNQALVSNAITNGYDFPAWRLFGRFGPTQVAQVIWPGLFLLFRQRQVRWLGLLADAAPLALMNLVAARHYPLLSLLWTLPVLTVVAGWMLDQSQRLRNNRVLN